MLPFILFSSGAFVLSLSLIPLIILFCRKYSLYDPVNARKIHSGNTPRLGGVAVVVSFLVVSLLCALIMPQIKLMGILPLLCSALIIFLFGFLDDLLDLKAVLKLFVQLVAVGIVICSGYRFTYLFAWKMPVWISVPLTFCWVLGIINAYNLIDGLDGLCGGLSIVTLATIGVLRLSSGDPIGFLCFILAASILGFLVFNWPPAKIFMGDCGSQFLGFVIAVFPLCGKGEVLEYNRVLIMLVLVSIPMIDTVAAIWRRLRDHRPIMSADRFHTHHKLLNLGLSKKAVLYLMLGIQFVICTVTLTAVLACPYHCTIILLVIYALVLAAFCVLHFVHKRKFLAVQKSGGGYFRKLIPLFCE